MANIHSLSLEFYPEGARSMGVYVLTHFPDKVLVGFTHLSSEEKSIGFVRANLGIHVSDEKSQGLAGENTDHLQGTHSKQEAILSGCSVSFPVRAEQLVNGFALLADLSASSRTTTGHVIA